MGNGERVGILGGTFDPPHVGHIVAAVGVRHALELDRVFVVPANVPWQKVGVRAVSPAVDRLAMVRAAFGEIAGLEVSTAELDRGGPSYTADTLAAFGAARPDDAHWIIVGSDVAAALHTWHRPGDVAAAARVALYERPGSIGGRPPAPFAFDLVAVPQLDVSSTDIRARVRRGAPVDGLVPAPVLDIIRTRTLYREGAA